MTVALHPRPAGPPASARPLETLPYRRPFGSGGARDASIRVIAARDRRWPAAGRWMYGSRRVVDGLHGVRAGRPRGGSSGVGRAPSTQADVVVDQERTVDVGGDCSSRSARPDRARAWSRTRSARCRHRVPRTMTERLAVGRHAPLVVVAGDVSEQAAVLAGAPDELAGLLVDEREHRGEQAAAAVDVIRSAAPWLLEQVPDRVRRRRLKWSRDVHARAPGLRRRRSSRSRRPASPRAGRSGSRPAACPGASA